MKQIRVLWTNGTHTGKISVEQGELSGSDSFEGDSIDFAIDKENIGLGAYSTLVHIKSQTDAFSFLLRDVTSNHPIYVPKCHAVVLPGEDRRDYQEVVDSIKATGGFTKLQRLNLDPEYDYDLAAAETRDLPSPTWLGISRDMRFFEVGLRTKSCGTNSQVFDYVSPHVFHANYMRVFHPEDWSDNMAIPELGGWEGAKYSMLCGRGVGCRHQITRRLEDGWMPILNARNEDDGIIYQMQFFATQERSPLRRDAIRGTDMYAAHRMGYGHMLSPKQRAKVDEVLESELAREEETVLYIRLRAENTLSTPEYAFVYAPNPTLKWNWTYPFPHLAYNEQKGFLWSKDTGRILALFSVNGQPMPQTEMSVLLQPGQSAVFEYRIPHKPLPEDRADALRAQDYDQRLTEARAFWTGELSLGARIHLPEKRIEEMIKAGLMHIDVGYFGKNPDGPVDPIVGIYTGIGSESSPGIQFLDAMGHHDLARRAIQFFLELQHDNGFIQNYEGYMLETGCVLWTMGEHFRMTRDLDWVKAVRGHIVRACDYLISWRHDNMTDESSHGNGFGMISGRVSDPQDFFHSFMLNAGTYAGLSRSAEMLADIDPDNAKRIGLEAEELRSDIIESYLEGLKKAPVLPARNGTWYQAAAPWAEYPGPLALYTQGGKWFTDLFTDRDQEGAMYLILNNVIRPDDPLSDDIVQFYTEFLTLNNTGFNQSYYSPHPFAHAHRGEVGAFLQEFYCGFSALADRETYSFWETFGAECQHKLHEEAWFLMRCRWMLCLEDYEKRSLRLLSMIPRRWTRDGEVIEIDGMRSYFGPVSLKVESHLGEGWVHVRVHVGIEGFPTPALLSVRIPHPDPARQPRAITLGRYNPDAEAVELTDFQGEAEFDLLF